MNLLEKLVLTAILLWASLLASPFVILSVSLGLSRGSAAEVWCRFNEMMQEVWE
jgi:hypothetical protein